MKYLVIFVVAIVVVGMWRNARKKGERGAGAGEVNKPRAPAQATEIVACALCRVHLPRSEALAGPGGVYCSAAHRQQADA